MRLSQYTVALIISGIVSCGQALSEPSASTRLAGSSESEIQSFLTETLVPLNEIQTSEIRDFFEELGDRSGFFFIVADGVTGELRVDRKKSQTYETFLEDTLATNGYTWRRQPGAPLIWITPDLATQRFFLSLEQRRSLAELAGKEQGKNRNDVIRTRILGQRAQKSPSTGQGDFQIKGQELVVTDTQSNLRKIKEYLDRHNPVESDRNAESLPTVGLPLNGANGGGRSIEEAAAQGRMMIPNREEGSITVVDIPGNLRKVDEYLSGHRSGSYGIRRIYEPRHRTPADLSNAVQGIVLYTIP